MYACLKTSIQGIRRSDVWCESLEYLGMTRWYGLCLSDGEPRMELHPSRTARWHALGIVGTVVSITTLHYVTSVHSVLLHEVFQRLYYLPVVAAGVLFGWRAALATSALASVLFVPHIVMAWHAWPVLQVDQYGEVLLFNLVGLVTGVLADRVRQERNRYREVAVRLENAHAEIVARMDERFSMDRLVTVGRLASGIAHEIRNPLGSLLGCLEILAPAVRKGGAEREEFLSLARDEIARLESIVSEFLEFARPAPPKRHLTDLRELVGAAVRLANLDLAGRGIRVDVETVEAPTWVDLDPEQLQRALVSILLDPLAPGTRGRLVVSVESIVATGRIRIHVPGVLIAQRIATQIFDPFPDCGNGHGLSLAVARRLIENQGGTAHVEADGTTLRYTIDLPLLEPSEPWAYPLTPQAPFVGSAGHPVRQSG